MKKNKKCARYSCPADQQADWLHGPVSCIWGGGLLALLHASRSPTWSNAILLDECYLTGCDYATLSSLVFVKCERHGSISHSASSHGLLTSSLQGLQVYLLIITVLPHWTNSYLRIEDNRQEEIQNCNGNEEGLIIKKTRVKTTEKRRWAVLSK